MKKDHTIDDVLVPKADPLKGLALARDRDAWRWMTGSEHGLRILRHLVRSTGVLAQGFSADALLEARRAGRREVGIEVLSEVRKHAPDVYPHLFSEPNDE